MSETEWATVISTGDLKRGIVVEMDGRLLQIVDWDHIKVGRGSAQVRLKFKDLRDGHVTEQTFQAGSKFNRVRTDQRKMQFLYAEGELRYFMDLESYEQTPLDADTVGDALPFLAENAQAEVLFVGDEAIGVELPAAVSLRVTQSEPGIKGDTASGATKPATLETGHKCNVPLFIGPGDLIRVDTRSGEYLERAEAAS